MRIALIMVGLAMLLGCHSEGDSNRQGMTEGQAIVIRRAMDRQIQWHQPACQPRIGSGCGYRVRCR
jgi:hypothetical protein